MIGFYQLILVFSIVGALSTIAKAPAHNAPIAVLILIGTSLLLARSISAASRKATATAVQENKVSQKTVHTISPSQNEYAIPGTKKPSKRGVKFIRSDQTVSAHGFTLRGPIFFGTPEPMAQQFLPHIIDPVLRVDAESAPTTTGYWPNYAGLDEAQRFGYLEWLAGDRDEPEDIGYAFLYFYGFEFYALTVAPEEHDKTNIGIILSEIERLLSVISNGSFVSYAKQLREVILIDHFPERLDTLKSECQPSRGLALDYVLATKAGTDEILEADWALQWVLKQQGLITKSVRNHYQLLRALFRQEYDRLGGITVPLCKTPYRLDYHPASRSVDRALRAREAKKLCNPIALKKPIRQLLAIHANISPAFTSAARSMDKGDLATLLELSTSYPELASLPELEESRKKLQALIISEPTTTLAQISSILSLPAAEKLTAAKQKPISGALRSLGCVLVPSPFISPTTVLATDPVKIYAGSEPDPDSMSKTAKAAMVAVTLGLFIGSADGELHENEISSLHESLKRNLSGAELSYAAAFLDWRAQFPIKGTAGLKNQLEGMDEEQRHFIGQCLAEVALADGQLPATEIKQLERIFDRIGIGSSSVAQFLHHRSAPATAAPVHREKKSPGLNLDEEALQSHQRATQEAFSVLASVFSEEEVAPGTPDTPETHAEPPAGNSESGPWHQGLLDQQHALFAAWLVTADEWPMSDVESKCQELGLMPSGALEKINDTAFDTLGDALLDMGESVAVYRDLLPA